MVMVGHIELVKDAGNWHTLSMKVNFGKDMPEPNELLKQISKALDNISGHIQLIKTD